MCMKKYLDRRNMPPWNCTDTYLPIDERQTFENGRVNQIEADLTAAHVGYKWVGSDEVSRNWTDSKVFARKYRIYLRTMTHYYSLSPFSTWPEDVEYYFIPCFWGHNMINCHLQKQVLESGLKQLLYKGELPWRDTCTLELIASHHDSHHKIPCYLCLKHTPAGHCRSCPCRSAWEDKSLRDAIPTSYQNRYFSCGMLGK